MSAAAAIASRELIIRWLSGEAAPRNVNSNSIERDRRGSSRRAAPGRPCAGLIVSAASGDCASHPFSAFAIARRGLRG